jgi:hypothetical protein
MRRFIVLALLAPAALGASPFVETWEIQTVGAISTSCTATVSETGGRLSGTVKCPKLGLVMPLDGRITDSDLNGSTQDGVAWTAQRDGDRYVGSYTSPLGLGTWVATRR